MKIFIAVMAVSAAVSLGIPVLRQPSELSPSIPDASFFLMQQKLLAAMDDVTGRGFIFNWLALLSPNVTVCYPFVGVIDTLHCLFGYDAVFDAWSKGPFETSVAIQQNSFWLSKSGSATQGVFKYTTSSSYLHNGSACVVQFEGVVSWLLDPHNTSSILQWLETPDSNRISATYPCKTS